jgi:serine/threonine protein phosphatase PrpC
MFCLVFCINRRVAFVADGHANGSLNLSRALGDMEYKKAKHLPPELQMVSAHPDVRVLDLKHGDDFCVLACDGIWAVLNEQQVCL